MSAFLLLFMQYLPQLIQAGAQGLEYVQKVRELAQQKEEWTQEQEDDYTAHLQDLKDNPPDWLKTDDQ